MEATIREQVRWALLRYLDANAGKRFPLSEAVLQQFLQSEGLGCERHELVAELQYLEGKGLAMPAAKTLSPENRTWVITAAGRDTYAERA